MKLVNLIDIEMQMISYIIKSKKSLFDWPDTSLWTLWVEFIMTSSIDAERDTNSGNHCRANTCVVILLVIIKLITLDIKWPWTWRPPGPTASVSPALALSTSQLSRHSGESISHLKKLNRMEVILENSELSSSVSSCEFYKEMTLFGFAWPTSHTYHKIFG